jgi:hypothetical protein
MKAFLTCFFIFSLSALFGQSEANVSNVALLDSTKIKDDKLVILLETAKYTVVTTYSILTQNFQNWLNGNPNINVDKLLLETIKKEARNGENITANKIASGMNAIDRLNFRIGELLSSGNCLVTDMIRNRRVKEIEIRKYSEVGLEGTKFYVDESLLLDVIDKIF